MNLIGIKMNERKKRAGFKPADVELTGMEVSCLKLTANGFRPAEIGLDLSTDKESVDLILTSAERKLGARNRLHAIGIAVSQGLIGIDGK